MACHVCIVFPACGSVSRCCVVVVPSCRGFWVYGARTLQLRAVLYRIYSLVSLAFPSLCCLSSAGLVPLQCDLCACLHIGPPVSIFIPSRRPAVSGPSFIHCVLLSAFVYLFFLCVICPI